MTRECRIPALYDDPPGTEVQPLGHGYEAVRRPNGRDFCRRALSKAGRRKHERLKELGELGWELVSIRGSGTVVHPSREGHLFSIAAAALAERLDKDVST